MLAAMIVMTVTLFGACVVEPAARAATPSSGVHRKRVPWETKVAKTCAQALRALDDLPDHFEPLDPGGNFADLSSADQKDAVAYFQAGAAAEARFAKQLDAITPTQESAKVYGRFVAAIEAESIAYKNIARKIRASRPDTSNEGAIEKEDAVVADAKQLASRLATRLGLACAVVKEPDSSAPESRTTTCYSGLDPTDRVEVSCGEPHNYELFIRLDDVFPIAGPYPSGDEAFAGAVYRCVSEFETFVGIPVEQSDLYNASYSVPDEVQWAHGDRHVDCFIQSKDEGGLPTGSAAGAKA